VTMLSATLFFISYDTFHCQHSDMLASAHNLREQLIEALRTCKAGGRPKRRKVQPATPISRSVSEALTDFVADASYDSQIRQHIKQSPVTLRTRCATAYTFRWTVTTASH